MESSVYPSLFTIIGDIRSFVLDGLKVLPLTVIGTSLIISLMSANYALLFMLVTMIILVPGVLFVGNMGLEFITSFLSAPSSQLFAASKSEICDLIPPFPTGMRPSSGLHYTFGSYWVAMMAFFFGYSISNAVSLLKKETQVPVNADDTVKNMVTAGANNRKTQAISAIITTLIFAIIVFTMRIRSSGCEPYITSIISIIIFAVFGWGMYSAFASFGQDRLSDIFGIANRLLSPDAMNNTPYACVPYTKSS